MGIFDSIGGWFSNAGKTISGAAQNAVNIIKKPFQEAGKTISGAAEQAKNTISQAVTSAGKTLSGAATQVYNDGKGVVNWIGKEGDKIITAGTSYATSVGNGLGEALGGLGKGLEGVGKGAEGLSSNIGYIAGAAVVGILGYVAVNMGGSSRSSSRKRIPSLSDCRISKRLRFA